MAGNHFDVTMDPAWLSPDLDNDPLPRRPRTVGHRNGLPGTQPYQYRRGEAGRDAEVAARVAETRARAQARAAREDEQVRQERAGRADG